MKRFYILVLLLWGVSDCLAQNNKKSVTLHEADSLYQASLWKDAGAAYEQVLKNSPDNSLAWSRLGYCYHRLNDFDKALPNYNKSLANKPTRQLEAMVYSRMAQVYSMKNDAVNAFANLAKALDAGYLNLNELQNEKQFDRIRSDARFGDVVKRATENAFPCMTSKQLREFDFWVGEWDVFPNGASYQVGQSKIEVAAGGCFILENWTALGPVPNTGKSMNFVNPETGKWEQLWIGSGGVNRNNPQRFVNGEYRDGAMRFEFESYSPKGEKQLGRFIFFNEGPDQVRQFNEVSGDHGKTWVTSYDFVYKRKK